MTKRDMKNLIIILCVCLVAITVVSAFSNITKGFDVPSEDEPSTDKPSDNKQPVDFSKMKYLAFGDSITAGAGLANASEAYPNQVAKLLDCSARNKGVGSSTLKHIDIRHCIADDVVEFAQNGNKYDIVSVMGGVNDHGRSLPIGTINDTTTDTVYGSLNIIAETLTTTYPDALVFFMTPMRYYNTEKVNSAGYKLVDIANAVKAVAQKYNIPVLDMFNLSQFETADCGMNNASCDGVHPIKEFVSEYMAPQIAQFIRDNYNK